MMIPLLARPAPQPAASASSAPAPGHPPRAMGLNRIQVVAIVAVFLCVAATVGAAVTGMDLNNVRIPIAGISLLCAFMSPASLPDWRGKAGFVVFMLFTAFVVLREDPTARPADDYLDDVPAPSRGSPQSTGTAVRRGNAAAAHLSLGSAADAPDARGAGLHVPEPPRFAATEAISLRLDSIRATNDGSPGTSDWRFDVYVNRHLQLPLGRRTFHDSPRQRPSAFTRAATPIVPAALAQNSLTVQVQGIRSALFGNYVASGWSEPVPLAELEHGQAKQVVVAVRADVVEHGDFSFFFTIRRP
ncbi:MAG TPA: hypothetical protein VEX86_14860 [Longimicrobium sp.]|nr:hypothetical protein [Longimicrobium sp.]